MLMPKEPLISFIISVYNLENYIGTCLNSIITQPFDDYEIILVNNNSTDGSDSICREYAANCNKIRYFILTGDPVVGKAGIFGANEARGEYLQYVDGDDMLFPGVYGEIADALQRNRPDILFGQFCTFLSEDVINFIDTFFHPQRINGNRKEKILEYLTKRQPFILALWRLIVSKSLRKQFSLSPAPIEVSTNIHQDVYISVQTFISATSFYYHNAPIYRYRVRSTSASRIGASKQFSECCEILLKLTHLMNYKAKSEQERGFVNVYIQQFYYQASSVICTLSKEQIGESSAVTEVFLKSFTQEREALMETEHIFPFIRAMILDGAMVSVTRHQAYCVGIIRQLVEQVSLKSGDIYLAPTGNVGLYIKSAIEVQGITISGFFDNDTRKNGIMIDRSLVCSPAVVQEIVRNIPVTIIVASRYKNVQDDLMEQFISLGINRRDIYVLEFI